ncbi:MAG: sigma-70 family RNA polymerase sigma factor [Chryseolinea sp.]
MNEKVERLYKSHFGKMVASLAYAFRNIDLEHVEDIVQESFSRAIVDWRDNGIPLNAPGWLYRVCRNHALNEIKEKSRLTKLAGEHELATATNDFSESILDDQQLKLLFACAHPDLSPKIQVVITLKYVINLKVEAIAKVLAMTIDGVDKILVRARDKIQRDEIFLSVPSNSGLRPRLSTVHKVIYLVFNEGYKTSHGNDLIREDLCEEALLLTKSLLDCDLFDHETFSLYSLMLFHAARFKSRFNTAGELVDLEHQDRSHWHSDLITLANYYLKQSRSETLSKFHIEACIAHLHCLANSFDETDWVSIRKLYSTLLVDNSNPFVELSYAIACYYSGEKETCFYTLNQLEQQPYMRNYYLLNATLGKLYARESKSDEAITYLEKAFNQTTATLEKVFINNSILKIREG